MNIDDKTYELIERYLGGLLSEEQKLAFEQEMKTNPELADQVRIFKMMPDYLDDNSFPNSTYESDHPKAKAYLDELLKEETRALKDHLQSKGEEFQNTSSTNTNLGVWRVLRVAAVLVVLVAAATFLFRPSETQRLYSSNVEHEELLLNVRGSSDQMAQEAERLFNDKRYVKALPLLQQLDWELTDNNYPLKLALGVAHLESGNEAEAIRIFDAIYTSDALIRNDALYYIGMAKLKSGDRAAAAVTLQQVRVEFPDYKAASIDELLSRL